MRILILIISLIAGCNITPVPKNIDQLQISSQKDINQIRQIAQQGDIIFRLSNTMLGPLDFSKEITIATESDFSHAVLVYKIDEDGVILADITPRGIAKRYLVDWYLDPSKNVVVTRLKPEYQYLIPKVLHNLKKLLDKDVLYDETFDQKEKYYCTEVVDECFRLTGHPLAEKVQIKSFPKSKLLFKIGCMIGGIDRNQYVAIAGNDTWGLFSSPMLEIVLDLRSRK